MESKIKPFISGSVLKLIAMLTMLVDHTAFCILSQIDFFTQPLFTLLDRDISLYFVLRLIGRLAFPIYAFLLVEGFVHTKNRKKYGIRLFAFALLSVIPWNVFHSGKLFYPSQNVLFTLFFGYLALCAIEYLDKDKIKQLAALALLFALCLFTKIDYGIRGYGLVVAIYLLRNKPIIQALLSACILNNGYAAALAFIPIGLYNGKRGFMKGKFSKYVCYLFYPLHMLVLGIIRYYVM